MDNQEEIIQDQELGKNEEKVADIFLELAIRCHEIERNRKQNLETKIGIIVAVLSAGFFIFSDKEYSFKIAEVIKGTYSFVYFIKFIIICSSKITLIVALIMLKGILGTTNYESLDVMSITDESYSINSLEVKKILIKEYGKIQKSTDRIREEKNKKFDQVMKLLLALIILIMIYSIL